MRLIFKTVLISVIVLQASLVFAFTPSGLLEVHYINVQQGGSTLIIGPDGTTILMDAGENGKGTSEVIPYLQSIGLTTSDDLDYIIAGHLHSDHIGGIEEVIYGGYNVLSAVYYSGSAYSNSVVTSFKTAANSTTGGLQVIALNSVIDLGDGATARCVATNGYVLGGDSNLAGSNENDRSIAILVTYGDFEYIFASDLSGGDDDEWCTYRHTATNYHNIETPLSDSLVHPRFGLLDDGYGLEVMHVNHHGSESAMNSDYMNNLHPAVACISLGWGQPDGWDFPRHDILDNVLLAEAPGGCVTADPALVLQTEEGSGGPDTYRSYRGYAVGDIIITTNGEALYWIEATGAVSGGPDERSSAGLPRYFPLDEDAGDATAPSAISNLSAVGGPNTDEITLSWTATGDDNGTGTAALYDIRYRLYSQGPIDSESDFNSAMEVDGESFPQASGSSESFTISGLTYGESYYFAIKAIDDNLNESDISNSPTATAGLITAGFNGDMEFWDDNGMSGPPDNWNVLTSSINAIQESGTVHGGSYSAEVTWTSEIQADCEFYSNVMTITEGEFYTCSLYVYDNDPAGHVALYYKWDTENSWGPTTYNSDLADWQLLTYTVQAPVGATTLEVVFRCYDLAASWDGDATIYLDDITLDEGFVGNLPPEFGGIYRYPYPVVYPEDNVAVRAEIIDDGLLPKDSLYYQMSTLLTYTAVGHDSIGTANEDYYWYTIPAASVGTLVEYYIVAEDDSSQRIESSVMSYGISEHPSNDLPNGDFELWTVNGAGGPPDNWVLNTGGYEATQEGSTVHGGNYSCNLTWTSQSTQSMNSEPLTITPGETYSCSVYVYDNDPAGRFRLCFISSDGNNSYPENYSSDQAGWQHLGYTWVAPATSEWVIVQPRMYDVSSSWDGNATVYIDDIVFSDTSTGQQENTIYEVQFNNSTQGSGDDCFSSPYVSQSISLTGTVVAIQQGEHPNYFLQDCTTGLWNGIYVYDDTRSLTLGQNISISGTVSEYYGLTELTNTANFVSNSSGNAICTTLVTSDELNEACNAGSEAYEGMLVRLNDVTCVVGPDSYGVGYLKSSGATDSCLFDDDMHAYGTDHPVDFVAGQTYSYVIGVVQYLYGQYKVNPRFASDVVISGNDPPAISNITRYPSGSVYYDDNVIVSAQIADDGMVTKDSIYVETIAASYTAFPHDSVNGDLYWYTIGVIDSGTTVNYYIVAIDDADDRTQSGIGNYVVQGQSGDNFEYLPGDANMAAAAWPPNVIGADVTYLVNYFRAIASPCLLDGFYASGDANGDCAVIGADVTYLVQYFRGANDIQYCPDYEPAWSTPDELPVNEPDGWPNCE